MNLTELSIVVLANTNNPTVLNVDFLKHTDIVDENFEVREPLISTPAFSQVLFKNGISVSSTPGNVMFKHDPPNNELDLDTCEEVVQIANRYLREVPHAPYRAIGINPKGFRNESEQKPIVGLLNEQGEWTSFNDAIPEIQLKAIYRFDQRTISLDIVRSKKTSDQNTQTIFIGNIHRDLKGGDHKSRIETLSSILNGWRADLEDYLKLTDRYK